MAPRFSNFIQFSAAILPHTQKFRYIRTASIAVAAAKVAIEAAFD